MQHHSRASLSLGSSEPVTLTVLRDQISRFYENPHIFKYLQMHDYMYIYMYIYIFKFKKL